MRIMGVSIQAVHTACGQRMGFRAVGGRLAAQGDLTTPDRLHCVEMILTKTAQKTS